MIILAIRQALYPVRSAPWSGFLTTATRISRAAHSVVAQAGAIRPLAKLQYELPTGFVAIPIPGLAYEKEQRLDQCLRSCFHLYSPDNRSHEAKPEIPLSLANSWVRKRTVRICDLKDGKLVELKEKPLSQRLKRDSIVLVHEGLLKDLRAGAPNTTLSAALAASGANGGATPVDLSELPPPTSNHAAPAFVRAVPTMKAPSWLSDCVRWTSSGEARGDTENGLVVISKPDGVATQGGSGVSDRLTVDFWLPAIEAQLASSPSPDREKATTTDLKLVHRLDKDVSGLMLLARGRKSAESIRQALSGRHSVSKQYLAIVDAPLPRGVPNSGTIDFPVTTSERTFSDRDKSKPSLASAAQDAVSEYHAFPLKEMTLLVLSPITGRKHQLRQHVMSLFKGTAGIAGDPKYRPRYSAGSSSTSAEKTGRLMLHSFRLTIDKDLLPKELPLKDDADVPSAVGELDERAALLRDIKAVVAAGEGENGESAVVRRLKDGSLQITDAKLPQAFLDVLRRCL
jgi:23S rRNA-/tRNA-specific pseudouridylate synthase